MGRKEGIMNYYYKVKETIAHYENRGITNVKIFMGEPIRQWIKAEVKGLKIEDLLEIEIGKHQSFIHSDEGKEQLFIIFPKSQLFPIYPDLMERLEKTEYETCPKDTFLMFDSTIATSIPIGYCHLASHKGLISKNRMNQRKCNIKQCPYLEKFNSHPMWMQKKNEKAKKKAKKEAWEGKLVKTS